MEHVDITIIGSGAIGLATSYNLSKKFADKDILVVEQYNSFGQETSSRNSEVIHAGLYYKKDSLKAKCCIEGQKLLYQLCAEHDIPHKKLGKLIIAPTKNEIEKIEAIYKNAIDCGVTGLEIIDKAKIKEFEPNIEAQIAIYSPDTGIIDTHSLMKFFYEASKASGVEFAFGIKVIGIKKCSGYYEITVKEPSGESFCFETKTIINSAGLSSDKIASMVGLDIEKLDYKINYNKGQYFRLNNPKKFNISRLIYPPPSKSGLGIHITPDLASGLRLGPDTQYIDELNYDVNEADKQKFYEDVRPFLSNLLLEDLIPDTAGIRPKLQKPNEAFHDFVIKNEADQEFENFINLIGIESPGITSCLSIADMVEELI
ncbi:MAG: NAD(P)/FAD-dependent oxidoreductase [Candidatus Zapsychrus exili]|nr:NAD(P)/FAD-dependent oxidoreductase [Candidatus Zapsychrus exili]